MRRFFHHDSPEQRAAAEQEQEYAARSLAALEAGGLPLRARERLERRAAGGDRAPLWTSDLSVDEFLAARVLRFEPLGQVLGASMYHIAYNVMQAQQYGDGEISAFSQAMYVARARALGRLREEATLLGAHGVIGVRLERKAYEWGTNLLEFVAFGTAVRLPGAALLKQPFLSDLSGQETLLLLQAGYVPVDLALGCCAYYVLTTWTEEQQLHGWGSWSNQEMTHFSHSASTARSIAVQHLAAQGRALSAEGIVGSDVELHVHEVRAQRRPPYSNDVETIIDHVVEFTAVGTAIVAIGRNHEPAGARLVLDVGGSRVTAAPEQPAPAAEIHSQGEA